MRILRYTFGFLLLTCALASCLPAPYYQKEEPIPQNEWAYNFKPHFTFEITDTTVQYEPTFIIRHTQAYPYANIWLWMYVKMPGDRIAKKERVNIVLAEPTGKWLGRGMGEIYEQRMKIKFSDSIGFSRKGTYTIAMEQNMRVNPLPDVLHVGLRMEKTGMAAQ
jgi:gliding motility-associated lipoprotein GldH